MSTMAIQVEPCAQSLDALSYDHLLSKGAPCLKAMTSIIDRPRRSVLRTTPIPMGVLFAERGNTMVPEKLERYLRMQRGP